MGYAGAIGLGGGLTGKGIEETENPASCAADLHEGEAAFLPIR